VYHDFKQTMIEVNIWGAFAVIGFSYDIAQNPYGLLFDKKNSDKARASWGFGNATSHCKVCRSGGERQSLDGLSPRNKSI
jgi:hypothetical protein